MPHSISEAARAGDATAEDLTSGRAWTHLLDALRKAADVVASDDHAERVRRSRRVPAPARAARSRDRPGSAVRRRPDPRRQAFGRRRHLQMGHGLPRLHLHGRPATRRRDLSRVGPPRLGALRRCAVDGGHGLVGQRAPRRARPRAGRRGGIVSLRRARKGNWLPIAENATTLVVRHFFYDWDTEVASSICTSSVSARAGRDRTVPPRTPAPSRPGSSSRSVTSCAPTWSSSCSSRGPRSPTRSCRLSTAPPWVPRPRTAPSSGPGSSGRTRPWWSRCARPTASTGASPLGNPWWETIDYGRHQSSLNGHQATVDDDGVVRAVIAHDDPGVANWLDTAGPRGRSGDPALRPHGDSARARQRRWSHSPTSPPSCPPDTRQMTPDQRERPFSRHGVSL